MSRTTRRRVIRLAIRPGPRGRIGLALITWGILGLGLLAVALLFVAGQIATAGSAETREDLDRSFAASRVTLRDAAAAVRGADAGLTDAAVAAGSAGGLMTEMSETFRGLAAALRITILGTQPFAGPAADFDRLADRAGDVADDLLEIESSIGTAAGDTVRLADSLDELERRMGSLQSSVSLAAGDGLDSARLLLATLLAWLAVPALLSLWLGIRWARPRRRQRAA